MEKYTQGFTYQIVDNASVLIYSDIIYATQQQAEAAANKEMADYESESEVYIRILEHIKSYK